MESLNNRYDSVNHLDRCIPILTREQGIARGVQPLSFLIDLIVPGGAGSPETSYTAVPHYITSDYISFSLANATASLFSVFDFSRRAAGEAVVELASPYTVTEVRLLAAKNYLDLIEMYTGKVSGRMSSTRAFPNWVGDGAVLGMQGGARVVERKLERAKARGVKTVAAWVQDWTGRRATAFGDRLWWSWLASGESYPDYENFVRNLRMQKDGIRWLSYVNPYLSDAVRDGQPLPQHAAAKERGCLLRGGETQISATPEFTFVTVNLSRTECMRWYAHDVIKKSVLANGEVKGFMADFAENVRFEDYDDDLDVRRGPAHNVFPSLWARTANEAIAEDPDAIFFTRSAFLDTPAFTPLMWLGDQMQDFNSHDGLGSLIPAMSSLGVSGFSLLHSDVGGYLGISVLGGSVKIARDGELMARWAEHSAFTDVMFRTHEGNVPATSTQVWDDDANGAQAGAAVARFSRVFAELARYRARLIEEARTRGIPVVRNPVLHYPSDPVFRAGIKTQIMLGDAVMFCPVTTSGVNSVRCHLPSTSHRWVHYFRRDIVYNGEGRAVTCFARLGYPCALVREDRLGDVG